MRYRTKDNTSIYAQCGCYLLIFLVNVCVGGWSINYLLLFFTEKTIPFIWATLIGLIAGEVSIPVAVVIAILRHFGIL